MPNGGVLVNGILMPIDGQVLTNDNLQPIVMIEGELVLPKLPPQPYRKRYFKKPELVVESVLVEHEIPTDSEYSSSSADSSEGAIFKHMLYEFILHEFVGTPECVKNSDDDKYYIKNVDKVILSKGLRLYLVEFDSMTVRLKNDPGIDPQEADDVHDQIHQILGGDHSSSASDNDNESEVDNSEPSESDTHSVFSEYPSSVSVDYTENSE